MKKLLTFITLNFILCINFFCFAQENTLISDESNNINLPEYISTGDSTISEETKSDNDISSDNEKIASLLDIQAGFCDKGLNNISNTLKSAVNQGTPFKVCFVIKNQGDVDADMEIRIIDKIINSEGYEVCSYSRKNIQNFISQEDLDDLSHVHIPAHNYIIKEFNVTFPIGINGEQKSCLTYHILNENESSAMLITVYNRYHSMDFFVGDAGDIDNKIDLNGINLYLNENKFLQLDFNVDNIGNLENQVTIHGTLSNIFGFKKDFEFNVGNIGVGGSLTGKIDLGPLPNYGGLFNVTLTATATPFFSYNIDESTFDKDLLEPKDFTVTASYFQMPWIAIIILIFVIMFTIVAFRKPKKEVVYVQAPQGPIPNNGYQQPQPNPTQFQQPQPNPTQFQQPYQNNNPSN